MAEGNKKKDVVVEARNFCDGLSNVFMLKKRDPQMQHLLEKAKTLIEALIAENQKHASSGTGTPRGGARSGGGMGQLWVKLDELKRENELLRKKRERQPGEKPPIPAKPVTGPGEVIISDLNKTKKDNEILKSKVDKLQTTLKEMESIQLNLQDEYKRAKVAVETSQKSMETVLKEYKEMEVSLKSARNENDSLKQKLTRSVKPMMRADNRLVENLGEKCRPSNIALLYDKLESQEWMDAKEALEETPDLGEEEDDVVQFLCACVMTSFQTSKEVYDALKATIAELIRKPTLAVSKSFIGQSNGKSKLPDDMTESVCQQLRLHFDEIDTDVIVGAMCEKLTLEFTEFIARQCHENKHVRRFMHACARITWQMIIQQPPMWLSVDDSIFNEELHKLWWSCDREKANKIDFFIWPCLFDYKRGNPLIKGCVHAS